MRYPFVDLAFGPGNISRLGEYVGAGGELPRGHFATFDEFAGDLPSRRERDHAAWVQISMGCNSTCSYCIVPSVRGREQSRSLARWWPRSRRSQPTACARSPCSARTSTRGAATCRSPSASASADSCAARRDPGIARIRYTSPHPKDMRDDVIAAHRECAAVCEHVHLPLQSGSTRILRAMRRTYSRERYLALAARLRAELPGLALTTDIIVGFPGETEADFRETLEVVDEVGYDHAFTFIYSPRRGTDAASMDGQVPDDVKHERLERLVERCRRRPMLATRSSSAARSRCWSRARRAPMRGACAARPRTNKTVIFPGPAEPGKLHTVRVEAATSMTLRAAAPVRRRPDDVPRSSPSSGPTASGKTATAVALAERRGARSSPPTRWACTRACRT